MRLWTMTDKGRLLMHRWYGTVTPPTVVEFISGKGIMTHISARDSTHDFIV